MNMAKSLPHDPQHLAKEKERSTKRGSDERFDFPADVAVARDVSSVPANFVSLAQPVNSGKLLEESKNVPAKSELDAPESM